MKTVKEMTHADKERVKKFIHTPLGIDSTCQRHMLRLSKADSDESVRRETLENRWRSFNIDDINMSSVNKSSL